MGVLHVRLAPQKSSVKDRNCLFFNLPFDFETRKVLRIENVDRHWS